jgi:hypothetical protein
MPQNPAQILLRKIRLRVESFPGRYYDKRHPGSLGRWLVALTQPLVARLTPNDKWSLGAHLPYWLKALDIPPRQPLPPGKRIFMFCAYRIQFTLDFMVAILLAWRGHKITFGYLPKLQSPIKNPLQDHPSAKPYLAAVLGQVEKWSHGRIRCIDLSDEPENDHPLDETFIASQVKSDVVMTVGREALDMADPETLAVWTYYEGQARQTQKIAWSHLSRCRTQYDLCLVANGATFEGAQFCCVSRALSLPVNTFEKFSFRKTRVMNHGNHFFSFGDIELAWNRRRELGYHNEPFYGFATGRAAQLLDERRQSSTETWAWALQSAPRQSADEAILAAGIETAKPFVLVCTNVPFDAGYDGLLSLFSSMREWLRETVRYLLENTAVRVVVRVHPAEGTYWGGKERSEEALAEFLDHERLTLIPSGKAVNTYGLIERCKFGVVFSSTTGMEMAMMGRDVLVGANVYYAKKGFTVDSDNRQQYFDSLSSLAALPTQPLLDEAQRREACLCHFMLHYIIQWPYPYDKPSDVQRLPPHKLLRAPDMCRYVPFLDALALSETEWQDRSQDFIRADGSNHIPVAGGRT